MRLPVYILLGLAALPTAVTGCSDYETSAGSLFGTASANEDFDKAIDALDAFVADTARGRWDVNNAMPDEDCIKLKVNYPGGTLKQLFNDSNYLHYAVAERLGIKPIPADSIVWPVNRPLVRVNSDRYVFVDELRHSYPYLVPESRELLDEIGRRFHDTLISRGGGPYRLKVTSMLRTAHSVRRLRRVNRASVDSSAHLFGTTFDISFTNFPYSGGEPHRTQEDLKNLLAEILYSLHEEGRCYIKYEHRPGCFHITARPKGKKQ